jgi:hypothetical protein
VGSQNGITDFAGKTIWCYRFMKRHGLSMCIWTRIAQKMPAEYEPKILEFQNFVTAVRKKPCFELNRWEHGWISSNFRCYIKQGCGHYRC